MIYVFSYQGHKMPFFICGLGRDISSIIWKKLNCFDKFIVLSSIKYTDKDFKEKYVPKNEWDDNKLIKVVCKNGYLDLVKWLTKDRKYHIFYHYRVCDSAAGGGHLEVLKWLGEQGYEFSMSTAMYAARGGHFELLKWTILNKKCYYDEATCGCAAKSGHLEMLKWLKEQRCPWDKSTYTSAMKNGDLKMLKWIVRHGCPIDTRGDKRAAKIGRLDILEWLYEKNMIFNRNTVLLTAAKKGHLKILEWCKEKEWGKEKGYPLINEEINESAAENNHFEILKWCVKNGCPLSEKVFASAARGGDLKILEWLREQGCPWDKRVCNVAATTGNYKILKWARENGCPWSKKIVYKSLISQNNLKMLKWILANGCALDVNMCVVAAKRGKLGILKWLRRQSCPWDERVCTGAIRYDSFFIDVLLWAIENGCPRDDDSIYRLIFKKSLWLKNTNPWIKNMSRYKNMDIEAKIMNKEVKIMDIFIKKGLWSVEYCRDRAVSMGRDDIVNWLDKKYPLTDPLIYSFLLICLCLIFTFFIIKFKK